MDEYQLELQDLRRTLARLREAEGDPTLIAEYEVEFNNLRALYEAAKVTHEAGLQDPELPRALDAVGMGEWTFDNVYSFVYEAAMDADLDGGDLASLVNRTDYAASLRAALVSEGGASADR